MDRNKKSITILIPAYNEQEVLPLMFERLQQLFASLPDYDCSTLFVNDGSSDNTLLMLRQMYIKDNRFGYISLSRNFGKEIAMLAGLDHCDTDCVVIMDADLQDPPEMIPEMLQYWHEGYDDVYARRMSRGRESWLRRGLSKLYYRLLSRMTSAPVLQNTGDFRLLDRTCVEALKQLRESQRYTKGMFGWIGFNKKEMTFNRANRAAGKTHWSMLQLFGLALEGITSSTTMPLKVSSLLGLLISVVAFCYMIWIIIRTNIYGDPVQGFPTLMVTILFLGGIQLLTIGIMGEYIGRIFIETKNRPGYFVRERDGELYRDIKH